MIQRTISLFIFLLISLKLVYAQECLYNDTMCACSFGSSGGYCYEFDRTADDSVTSLCNRRACDPGWTCDCQGDYYCDQTEINVYQLVNANDYLLETDVPCEVVSQRTITSSGFQVGHWYPQFSNKGLLDQQCQVFSWWLNGELQNEFTYSTTVTASNVETVKATLSDWNSLPLRSGSVIGFRWKDAPYSCYNSLSQLSINGTVTDTTNTDLVTHRFSHIFENDWMATDFSEGSNWQDPLETTYEDTYGELNTEITNTYWRIKVL